MKHADKLDDLMLGIKPSMLSPLTLGLQLERLEPYANNVLLYMDKHHINNPLEISKDASYKIFEKHFEIIPLMRINSPDVSPGMLSALGKNFWYTSSNQTRDKKLKERIEYLCLRSIAKGLKTV